MKNDLFIFDVSIAISKIRLNVSREEISKISKISSPSLDSNESRKQAEDTETHFNKISRISRPSTINLNPTCEDSIKIIEAKKLIRRYARYYEESEENIEEYITDQLKTYPLNDLIKCFKLLNTDILKQAAHPANVANLANALKATMSK